MVIQDECDEVVSKAAFQKIIDEDLATNVRPAQAKSILRRALPPAVLVKYLN